MNTRKVYIPTPDLNDCTKNLNMKGLSVFMNKEECAATYAGRFEKDLDKCRKSIMAKISELEINYVSESDFIPENRDRWINPACPPIITVYAAYDFDSKKIAGLYTKQAGELFAEKFVQLGWLLFTAVCVVPLPK